MGEAAADLQSTCQLRAERSEWEEEKAELKQVCVCVHVCMSVYVLLTIGNRKRTTDVVTNQVTTFTLIIRTLWLYNHT